MLVYIIWQKAILDWAPFMAAVRHNRVCVCEIVNIAFVKYIDYETLANFFCSLFFRFSLSLVFILNTIEHAMLSALERADNKMVHKTQILLFFVCARVCACGFAGRCGVLA